MIIDFHAHTFPPKVAQKAMGKLQKNARAKIYTDGTAEDLERSMKKAGVDITINLPVATAPDQPHKLNIAAVGMNERSDETGIISFGAMHPLDPDWREELDFIAEHGIKGIKLHPAYQDMDFDDIRYLRIIGRAEELGLIIQVHAGEDIGIPGPARCSPENAKRVLKETGATKLVLAHMGGWNIWRRVEEELAGGPFYIDTSFSFGKINFNPDYPRSEEELKLGETEQLVRLIRAHGAEKVLFGTDSPWGDQEEDLTILRSSGLTAGELKKIEGENAAKLLGLM